MSQVNGYVGYSQQREFPEQTPGGPRRCGKRTGSQGLLKNEKKIMPGGQKRWQAGHPKG